MNSKALLIKSITLLFMEAQLVENSDKSRELIENVISTIKMPELNVTLDHEAEILFALRKLALEMAKDPSDTKYTTPEMVQRVKLATMDEPSLAEAFSELVEKEYSQEEIKRMVGNAKRSLNHHFKNDKIRAIINQAYKDINFKTDHLDDFGGIAEKVINELELYRGNTVNNDPAIVGELCTSVRDSVVNAFKKVNEEETGAAIIKLGVQGMNRMFRHQLKRGDFMVVSALQHNYKTGMTLNLFRQTVTYNEPVMIDPSKKPLAVWISFEDSLENNLRMFYTSIRCNEIGGPIPADEIAKLSVEELADYVITKLSATGFTVKILRVNPSAWTYRSLQDKVREWENDGYEVQIMGVDYLSLLPTTGCVQNGPTGTDKRDLFRRTRNFMNPRKILFMTPHQLSSDAKELIRQGKGEATFVKEIANKGYYEGSKQIDQEVDIEVHIHLVTVNGTTYVTAQRGKHRGIVGATPAEDKYTCLPMMQSSSETYNSGVLDDVNGEDMSCAKPGAASRAAGGASAWWDTEQAAA